VISQKGLASPRGEAETTPLGVQQVSIQPFDPHEANVRMSLLQQDVAYFMGGNHTRRLEPSNARLPVSSMRLMSADIC
jgi:hypothetical protein